MRPKINCPQCKKNTSSEEQNIWPFCSQRCKTFDLGAWASEKFRVASADEVEIEEISIDDREE